VLIPQDEIQAVYRECPTVFRGWPYHLNRKL
jgi:hypothetical protein